MITFRSISPAISNSFNQAFTGKSNKNEDTPLNNRFERTPEADTFNFSGQNNIFTPYDDEVEVISYEENDAIEAIPDDEDDEVEVISYEENNAIEATPYDEDDDVELRIFEQQNEEFRRLEEDDEEERRRLNEEAQLNDEIIMYGCVLPMMMEDPIYGFGQTSEFDDYNNNSYDSNFDTFDDFGF